MNKSIVNISLKAIIMLGIVMSVFTSGCHSKQTNHAEATSRQANDTVTLSDLAFKMMREGKPFDEYIRLQREAVAQLREGNPQSDAIDILSQTGHMLMRHGDYEEALLFLQEAADSAQKRVDAGRLDVSMIQMQNNIGIIYIHFGLSEEALQENVNAIELSEHLNHEYYSDLWRMRGAMFNVILPNAENKTEISDSILLCIQKAYQAIPLMPNEFQKEYEAKCNFDKAALFVENYELFSPDSITSAISLLKSIDIPKMSNSRDVLLGRAYVLNGNHDKGISLMEKELENFRHQDWKESIDWTLDLLARSYAEAGRGDRLAMIYPEVREYNRNLINETKINALIGNDFRYRLREKQQELKSLQEKHQRYHIILWVSISAALIGLAIGIFLSIIYRKLKSRALKEKQDYQDEIDEILSQQVALNSQIEQLNMQLDSKENSDVIENVTVQLNPTLLNGENGLKFRKAFMSLYPTFLTNLRSKFPILTAADELICMLIYLKVPPLDMAAALGISRSSLNSARYRIRKRLNLDKDTNLDSFIESIA